MLPKICQRKQKGELNFQDKNNFNFNGNVFVIADKISYSYIF